MKNLTEIFSDFEKGRQKWGHRNTAEPREEKKCIPDKRYSISFWWNVFKVQGRLFLLSCNVIFISCASEEEERADRYIFFAPWSLFLGT